MGTTKGGIRAWETRKGLKPPKYGVRPSEVSNSEYCKAVSRGNPRVWISKTISRIKCKIKKRKGYKAYNRDTPINIDIDYMESIWNERCPILGVKYEHNRGVYRRTIDRIVPELGYVKGNVRFVCDLANNIMNCGTPEQVMRVAEYMRDNDNIR